MGHVNSLESGAYNNIDLDEVISAYGPLLVDLVSITLRPTKTKLRATTMDVFGAPKDQCDMSAQRIVATVAVRKAKAKSITSGKEHKPCHQHRVCRQLEADKNGEHWSQAFDKKAAGPKHTSDGHGHQHAVGENR